MIQFNNLIPKSLLQDLTNEEANDISGGVNGLAVDPYSSISNINADKTVQDLMLMTAAMGAVTEAQIYSSIPLSMQTASRQIAKRFGDSLSQTSR